MIERFRKILFVLLVLICCVKCAIPKDESDTTNVQGGGLKFSRDVNFGDRTSLSLFPDYKKLKGDLSLSFDCDISKVNQFAYIFRLVSNKNGKESVLLHLHQTDELKNSEAYGIQLYSPVTKSKIDFIVTQKKLNINIRYNSKKKNLTVNCNGIEKSIPEFELDKVRFNIIFGLWRLENGIAAMTLRNVRIRENNKTTHFWPLNEYEGSIAHDKVSGVLSEVSSPVWLQKEHFYWKPLRSFKADAMAGIVYKDKSQEIHIVNKDSMIVYAPYADATRILRYAGASPFRKKIHFSTFNESTNQIIDYNYHFLNSSPGKKLYSVLDEETLKWSAIDEEDNFQNNIYHRSFWNTKDGTFYTFAGRTNHTYSNDFKSFDFRTNTWSKIEMTGDFISPRIFTVVGHQKETNLLYVFGGYGNESGQHIEGSQVYKDLFSVDLSNKSIQKIMDFESFQQDLVPFGNLIIGNTEGTIFYALMGQKKTELNLRLYEINTLKKNIVPVSDTLKMNRHSAKSFSYLFKDSLNQKLYYVFNEFKNKNKGEAKVYSLNFPPSQLTEVTTQHRSENRKVVLLASGAILLVLGLSYFVLRKRKHAAAVKKNSAAYFRPNKNAILFLGGFQIFDAKGMDITYRFSKKLKELFTLIITETVQNNGITSKGITTTLWPGMDKTKQKNNQGYNIHAVRKILEDINGISLNQEGEKWKIECTGDCYFDFARVRHLMQAENPTHKEEIISLFSYGNLLPFLQFVWLDKTKAIYENDVISILLSICNDCIVQKNYLTCFETARIIHEKYDEINEEALRYKIISLDKMKGHSKSKNEFELFKRRYFATYQKPYALTIDALNKLT